MSSAGRSDNCTASDLALCPADGEVASRLLGVVAADPGVLPPGVGVRGDWGIVGKSGSPSPLFPSARGPFVSSLKASTTPEGEAKLIFNILTLKKKSHWLQTYQKLSLKSSVIYVTSLLLFQSIEMTFCTPF